MVKIKVNLLEQLKTELKPGVSLDTAINTVKSGAHKKHAHLLFEGRTGKVLKAA